jgi:dipeptidase D
MIDTKTTAKVIAILASVQNGVIEKSRNIDGLVEFSRNLGIIKTEGGRIYMSFSSRSAIESQLDASIAEINAIARANGCEASHHSRYPGWAFKENSPLRDKYKSVYGRIFGTFPNVSVIHAGLECGIISGKIPDMDMISVGPNMYAIHSPDEALSLESVGHVWRVLLEVLAEI